jgi:hypothetical protein
MIFKVQKPNHIFCEIYDMTSMFDVVFISVPLLSISSIHKKSKLIDMQLELNHPKNNIWAKLKIKKFCTIHQ